MNFEFSTVNNFVFPYFSHEYIFLFIHNKISLFILLEYKYTTLEYSFFYTLTIVIENLVSEIVRI